MAFNALNTIGKIEFLPKKCLKDLTLDELYKITGLKEVYTMFGNKYVVNLNDAFQIFLPNRFHEFFKQNSGELTNSQAKILEEQVYLKYLGNCKIEFVRN